MSNQLPHDISEQQLELWIRGIRGTIWYLLENMEDLLSILATKPIRRLNIELVTTALYTHALEEYGKLVLLSTIEPIANRIALGNISRELRDHNVKIDLALLDLPDECSRVIRGSFSIDAFASDSFQTHNPIDWNTRLDIFNTDIDANGDVHPTPKIDLSGLQQAITEFKTAHFLR